MESRKILIVEDDEPLRNLYSVLMNEAGMQTILAKNGAEAITKALDNKPDIILMDVMLPDITGHEAVEKIRLDGWGKNAKIIFLTNRTDAESVYKAVEQGGDEYIIKAHTSNKELLNMVRSSLVI